MTSTSQAREIADRLLLHILGDHDLLGDFLTRGGIEPAQLGAVVNGPEIHEFVLDFVTESDDRIIACAGALGIGAGEIGMAARLLARRD